jgi:acetyltransferase
LLYETPVLADEGSGAPDREAAARIVAAALKAGRRLLTEAESKALLAAYGVPTVPTRVARTPDEAVGAAAEFGFPVAVKLHSETITHKSDVGGVRLNVADADGVRRAFEEIRTAVGERAGAEHFQGVAVQPMVTLEGYELIVGASVDEQFGPVILFGTGGTLVEVFRDRALGLPPLTSTLARRLMERTHIYEALRGVRGRPGVDLGRLEQLLVRVSQLVVEQPRVKELDINPLLASPAQLVALDARIVLHPADVPDDALPRPAIRPYPHQYDRPWQSPDGLALRIRPIRPEDEPLMAAFHATLSERTVYLRYLHPLTLGKRTAHERLVRVCFADYDRDMVLVAERQDPAGRREIVGVGRLSRLHGREEAEFALLVTDRFQRRGLGTELLRRLIAIARDERLSRVVGYIAADNEPMLRLARETGFRTRRSAADPALVEAWLDL